MQTKTTTTTAYNRVGQAIAETSCFTVTVIKEIVTGTSFTRYSHGILNQVWWAAN